MPQSVCGLQSQKYLLSSPLQKKCANFRSKLQEHKMYLEEKDQVFKSMFVTMKHTYKQKK